MRNLIIRAELVNPPSELVAFRTLTLMSKIEIFAPKYLTLIEVEREFQDIYYSYMKEKGVFDYIDDIVYPEWNLKGVRIGPPRVDRINSVNINYVLQFIC